MKCSFSIENNDIESGQGMTLTVEGIHNPSEILGKKCIVKLYEIDTMIGKRKETTQDDLLAVFETEILKGSNRDIYFFDTGKTMRTDTFNKKLPGSEVMKDPLGNTLPVSLLYTPPHFDFYFDQGTPRSFGAYTILIQSEATELEMYVYEIGFTIEIDGTVIYDARKTPAYVNCIKVLAENCRNAAEFFRNNHNELIKTKHIGTHFGDHFIYAYKSECIYLEMLSRHHNGSIDESWILANTGAYWDKGKKIDFDSIVAKNGIKATSCIDYVIDTMKLGFEKSQMNAEWQKNSSYIKKGMGQWLAKGLTENGWVALYYNPDVNHPNDDDNEHVQSFLVAKNKRQYGSASWPPIVPVFDFIINYKPTHLASGVSYQQKPFNTATTLETKQIDLLKKVPFGFLMSRGGTHTALISKGNVYQVHWSKGSNSKELFDKTDDFVNKWEWNSGLIVTPRSFWPVANHKFK